MTAPVSSFTSTGRRAAAVVCAALLCFAESSIHGQEKKSTPYTDDELGFSIPAPGDWKPDTSPAKSGQANVVLLPLKSERFLALYVTVRILSDAEAKKHDLNSLLDDLEKGALRAVRNGRRQSRRHLAFKAAGGPAWELIVTGLTEREETLFRRYVVFATGARVFIIETVGAAGAETAYRQDIAAALDGFRVFEPKVKLTHSDTVRLFSIDRPGPHWDFVLQGGALGPAHAGMVKKRPAVFAAIYVTAVEKGAEKSDPEKLVADFRTRAKGILSSVKEDTTKQGPFKPTGDPATEVVITGFNNQKVELVRRAFIFVSAVNGNAYIVESVASRKDAEESAKEMEAILTGFKALAPAKR